MPHSGAERRWGACRSRSPYHEIRLADCRDRRFSMPLDNPPFEPERGDSPLPEPVAADEGVLRGARRLGPHVVKDRGSHLRGEQNGGVIPLATRDGRLRPSTLPSKSIRRNVLRLSASPALPTTPGRRESPLVRRSGDSQATGRPVGRLPIGWSGFDERSRSNDRTFGPLRNGATSGKRIPTSRTSERRYVTSPSLVRRREKRQPTGRLPSLMRLP